MSKILSTPIDKQFEFWSNHADKKVMIENIECRIHVGVYNARYPYSHQRMVLTAEPTDKGKETDNYMEAKSYLGDDWVYDLDDISIETLTDVVDQLNASEEFVESLS